MYYVNNFNLKTYIFLFAEQICAMIIVIIKCTSINIFFIYTRTIGILIFVRGYVPYLSIIMILFTFFYYYYYSNDCVIDT